MRLWLIRHGETQANIDGLYSGHAPTPLTARGIEQAQNLHTLLHGVSFDLVLCSELERAQHTARRVLSDRQLPVQIIPELNEMFFGDWEMRHHRDLMQEDAENYSAWCNDWQHAIPTNGEGFQAFSQRVERFIARLSEFQHYQNILVAQEVQEALADESIPESDFAALCTEPPGEERPDGLYTLRYGEIQIMAIAKIQQMAAEIAKLKEQVAAEEPPCRAGRTALSHETYADDRRKNL